MKKIIKKIKTIIDLIKSDEYVLFSESKSKKKIIIEMNNRKSVINCNILMEFIEKENYVNKEINELLNN